MWNSPPPFKVALCGIALESYQQQNRTQHHSRVGVVQALKYRSVTDVVRPICEIYDVQ
jgi:hypothetical protein